MRYEDSCVNEEFNKYVEEHSSTEPEILKELFRDTHIKMINPRMISGCQQSHLLRLLVRLKKPHRALEIGTFTGYSALSIGMELPDQALLYTIEVNEENEDLIQTYIQKADLLSKIKLLIGNALDIIPTLNEKWDLVFIDGNKEEYHEYFDLIADNINPGGLVIVDNILWSGKVLIPNELENDKSTKTIDSFNKRIRNDHRFETLLLPVRDGIMITQKKSTNEN